MVWERLVSLSKITGLSFLRQAFLFSEGFMKNKQLTFNNDGNSMFEITVVIRDSEGNPITTRSFSSNNPYKIWEYWQKNRPHKKRTKKKGRKEKTPTGKLAEKILKEIGDYAEEKQKERSQRDL